MMTHNAKELPILHVGWSVTKSMTWSRAKAKMTMADWKKIPAWSDDGSTSSAARMAGGRKRPKGDGHMKRRKVDLLPEW